MKKISILVAAILISFLSSGLVKAQMGMGKMHPGFNRAQFIKQLNLSDNQLQQFNKYQFDSQNEAIDLRAQIQKKRLKIKNMMQTGDINSKELLNLTNQISDIQAKLKESKVRTWLNIYKILNKEQQKLWVQHFRMMGNKMREGFRNHFMGKKGFNGMRKFRNFPPMPDGD